MTTEEAIAASRGRVYGTPSSVGGGYRGADGAPYNSSHPGSVVSPPVPRYSEIAQHSAPPGDQNGSETFRKVGYRL